MRVEREKRCAAPVTLLRLRLMRDESTVLRVFRMCTGEACYSTKAITLLLCAVLLAQRKKIGHVYGFVTDRKADDRSLLDFCPQCSRYPVSILATDRTSSELKFLPHSALLVLVGSHCCSRVSSYLSHQVSGKGPSLDGEEVSLCGSFVRP